MKANKSLLGRLLLLAAIILLYTTLRMTDQVSSLVGMLALLAMTLLMAVLWSIELIRERARYETDKAGFWLDLLTGCAAMFALVTMTAMQAANYVAPCALPR